MSAMRTALIPRADFAFAAGIARHAWFASAIPE